MRGRRYIALLAIVGLLVQAAAVVRHHLVMLAGALAVAGPVENASSTGSPLSTNVICHAAADASGKSGSGSRPADPPKGKGGCPICSGLASSVLLTAPAVTPLALYEPSETSGVQVLARLATIIDHGLPSVRGPPSLG